MNQFVALHPQAHQQLRIDSRLIEAQGAQQRLVPVVLSEFLKLVVDYPIVFTKNADTGRFVCAALLGFDERENLFWQAEQWQSIYVPLHIQRQPFFIGEEQGQTLVCLDQHSPCISREQGELLFTAQGEETLFLQQAKAILAELVKGEQETQEFIHKLLQLNLLTPMALEISFANGQSTRVQGLYTIDEARLAMLSDEQRLELHALGYWQPIYTLLASLGQIYALIHKKNARLAQH